MDTVIHAVVLHVYLKELLILMRCGILNVAGDHLERKDVDTIINESAESAVTDANYTVGFYTRSFIHQQW